MRAVGYQLPLPIEDERSLQDILLPDPVPTGRDLLVAVNAVAVNPVDTEVRGRIAPDAGAWKVLGWDGVGMVEAVGSEARLFAPGDAVFYAGAFGRQGTNAQYHLVDERIVGHKPASLSASEAAAIPLAALTAWETLFDRLDVRRPVPGAANAILVDSGVGGVDFMAAQLAARLTDLTVIATSSRVTAASRRDLGAPHVIITRDRSARRSRRWASGHPPSPFRRRDRPRTLRRSRS